MGMAMQNGGVSLPAGSGAEGAGAPAAEEAGVGPVRPLPCAYGSCPRRSMAFWQYPTSLL